MDKTVIKVIVFSVILLLLIGVIIFLAISNLDLGVIKTASIKSIAKRNKGIYVEGNKLAVIEESYDNKSKEIKSAEDEYNKELKKYEAISDETLQIIKEATMEKEYSLEYLWVTLGNYAKAHKLTIAIIEPGGSTATQNPANSTEKTAETTVSTGTGIKADSDGKVTTDNKNSEEEKEDTTVAVTDGLTASTDAATIQIKGNYIDLADFVYEVENDKDLRFRLDNISMKSAGGSDVIASFKVKNLAVISR